MSNGEVDINDRTIVGFRRQLREAREDLDAAQKTIQSLKSAAETREAALGEMSNRVQSLESEFEKVLDRVEDRVCAAAGELADAGKALEKMKAKSIREKAVNQTWEKAHSNLVAALVSGAVSTTDRKVY